MKHLNTFEHFLNEGKDEVIFSVDDDKLDQMLNARFSRQLDYKDDKGDSLYVLPKREFDQFIDLADSSGFDVDYEGSEDSVIYVYESTVNESYDKFIVGKTYTHPQLGKFKVLELSSDSKTKVEFLEGDGKGAILYIAGYGSEGY